MRALAGIGSFGGQRGRWALPLLALILVWPSATVACDICAIYTATEMQTSRSGARVGLAQQFTRFTTLQDDGQEIANPRNERMTSSITQLIVGYQLHPDFGVQVALPWIHRDFRRARGSVDDEGDETGFGDLSLVASYAPWARTDESGVFRLTLLGGLKLPSGSSERLREELEYDVDADAVRDRLNDNMGSHRNPGTPSDAPVARPQGHSGAGATATSGIHGHDLALGTGSVDPVFGLQALWTRQRFVLDAGFQYVLRTEGRFDYEYADELTAHLNPGVFAVLDDRRALVLQLATTIEHKGDDELDGSELDDTALTAVYLGPGLHFTLGSALSLDFVVDLPVHLDNSAVQIVPDYRLRAGFLWRF